MIEENSNQIYIECKDHSVSGEKFQLVYNTEYDFLETRPKPLLENLAKYYESEDYISHTDGSRSLFEKLYQIVKKYALSKKVKLITGLKKEKGQLLDIGAGTGDFLISAKKGGWQVKGTEPNQQAQDLAKQKGVDLYPDTSVFETQKFDVITMWHVLEHVPDLEFQINELQRLLKSGGILIIAVPNYKSYDASYYGPFWAAYDVPRHLWHFSEISIKKLFLKKNFEFEKTLPMKFDSYYVSLLSEKYKTGSMNFIQAFYHGIVSNLKGLRTNEYSSHIYVLKKK